MTATSSLRGNPKDKLISALQTRKSMFSTGEDNKERLLIRIERRYGSGIIKTKMEQLLNSDHNSLNRTVSSIVGNTELYSILLSLFQISPELLSLLYHRKIQ